MNITIEDIQKDLEQVRKAKKEIRKEFGKFSYEYLTIYDEWRELEEELDFELLHQ